MKTSVFEVHDMLSVLTVDEVEKRISGVPGVDSATVNYAAGNATVRYDETRLEVADIKVMVHQRGPQAAGESLPVDGSEHAPSRKPDAVPTPKVTPASASKPEAAMPKTSADPAAAVPPVTVAAGDGQQDKTAPIAQPSAPESAAPKAASAAVAAPIVRAGDGQQGKATPSAPPSATPAAAPKAASDAKAPTPAAAEPNPGSWKVHGLSLMVTVSVAYALCAISTFCFRPSGCLLHLRRPVRCHFPVVPLPT